MKNLEIGRYTMGLIVAATMLAGCGGSQPPIGVPATPSHILESAATKGDNLVYASGLDGRFGWAVFGFSYPEGKLLETITGQPGYPALCADQKDDVFVVDTEGDQVDEYNGTNLINRINDPYHPLGCAVDPKTGNLATAGGDAIIDANVAIFLWKDGKYGGGPEYMDSQATTLAWCTYDRSGNVFASGSEGSDSALDELPRGSGSLRRISINKTVSPNGAVQWDGKYLAIRNTVNADPHGPAIIYQMKVSGSTATVVNTVKLSGPKNKNDAQGSEFWIQGTTIASPQSNQTNVGLWHYPAGGSPFKILRIHAPWGVAITESTH